jgi:hypothetical protein
MAASMSSSMLLRRPAISALGFSQSGEVRHEPVNLVDQEDVALMRVRQ